VLRAVPFLALLLVVACGDDEQTASDASFERDSGSQDSGRRDA